ncbi:hypothetical protein SGRIM128S_00583 [Streptomyces griseomycini]
MHQIQQRHLTCAAPGRVLLAVGLPPDQRDDLPVVAVGVAEQLVLGLDRGESALRVELAQHRPQQRRLAGLLLPRDHDVLLRAHTRAEELTQDRVDRAQPDQVVQVGVGDAVPADDRIRHRPEPRDGLQPGPVLQRQRQRGVRGGDGPLLVPGPPGQLPQQLQQLLFRIRDRPDHAAFPVAVVQPHLVRTLDDDVLNPLIVQIRLQPPRPVQQVIDGTTQRLVFLRTHRRGIRPHRDSLSDPVQAALLLAGPVHVGGRLQELLALLGDLRGDVPGDLVVHRHLRRHAEHPGARGRPGRRVLRLPG